MSRLLGLPNFLRPLGSVGPCTVHLSPEIVKRYITLPNRLQLDDNEDHCNTIMNGRLLGNPPISLEDNGEFELETPATPETPKRISRFKEIDYDNKEYPIISYNPYLDPPSQQAFKKSRSKKSKGKKKSKKSKGKKKSKGSKKSN